MSPKKSVTARPLIDNWQYYESSQPTESTPPISSTNPPANHFDNQIVQNDMNDKFDQDKLLKLVPKQSKQKAVALLKAIDNQSNQLTWDSSGVIYCNQESIPNSNIYVWFPFLFKKRIPKFLEGFNDFLTQLELMGLTHLTSHQSHKGHGLKSEVKNLKLTEKTQNWWYLG